MTLMVCLTHLSTAAQILKFMLKAHTAPDTPPAAKMKLNQHILLRMADLLVKGGRFGTYCMPWRFSWLCGA